ncbi:MAG: hypothetical protein K2Y23_10455 [Cyanobacteria bacterium]|nr:hypothetical protein [Cyanobacteriota bacterium]
MIIIAVMACLAAYLAVAGPAALVFGLLSQAIFVAPGLLIVRAIAPSTGWLAIAAFGPLIGQALGSLVMTLLWVAGGRGPWLIIAAPIIVGALIPLARRLEGRWTLPATAKGDSIAAGLLIVLVMLVVAWPFAHVGDITPAGQAYRAYFTADYVWRRAVVIELAKGASPLPVNPYFAGDVLHYYWMPHILPGVQYRFAAAWASLDELLLIQSISIDVFFILFLYGMARLFRVKPWAAACGTAFVIVSTSFEGLYALFDFSSKNVSIAAVRDLNIDAISRWYFQGIPIDGLQRLLFYQPHHIIGYCIGLIGLVALAVRARAVDPAAFFVSGICLGLSIAISSFAGLMVTSAAMLYELVGVVRTLDWRRVITHAIAAAIPLLASVGVVFWLGYVDRSGSVVEFTVNPVAVHRFWWTTFLSMGPILIVAALAIPALIAERRGLAVLGALTVTSIVFYFFINVRDHQDVYVGWRVGHFMFMSAAVVIGVLLEYLSARPSAWQPVLWGVIVAALLAGLPTTIIDIYNTQDISEHGEAPYWTLMLRPDELQAFDWIKKNTRLDATFQVDPMIRFLDGWAYLPAFAERRMAVGFPISMIPLRKYEQGSNAINAIFDEAPLAAYERGIRAGVHYVLIGPPERKAHPGVEERFNSIPNQMPLAWKNGTISIYEVRQGFPQF